MFFIDKIRRFFRQTNSNSKEEKIFIKKEELEKKIGLLLKENKNSELRLKKQIEREILQFEKEMKNYIENLEKVDLSKRKEAENIKRIILQNKETYLFFLKELSKKIKEIYEEKKDTEEIIHKIFQEINGFYKLSRNSYEKTTYLIGKEMAITRELFTKFAKKMENISEENKSFFEEKKRFNELLKFLEEFKESERLRERFEKEITEFETKIKKLDREQEELNSKIEKRKESPEYKKELEKNKERLAKRIKIEEELEKIKKKIDFKAILNMFHNDNKKVKKIKEYSNNFKFALEADDEIKIIELVRESQKIDISNIKDLKESLLNLSFFSSKIDEEILELNKNIERLGSEKEYIENEINKEKKKIEKIILKNEGIFSDLKEALKFFNLFFSNKDKV